MQTEKQRERLVELLDKAFLECDDNYGRPCTEQVADYLMSNNVVVLPMKLGQSCFNNCSYRNDVDECRVSSITQKADGTFKIRLTNLREKWVFEITENEIGKRVFLERAEAEAKLREMQNGN